MFTSRNVNAGWTGIAVGALASLAPAGTFGPGPGGVIPDAAPAGLTSVIQVNAPGATIYRLNSVTLQFGPPAHSFVGDLHAKLTAPSGRTMHLFSRVGATDAQPWGDGSDLSGSYIFVAALDGPSFAEAALSTDDRATIPPGTYARSTNALPAGVPEGINTTDFANFVGESASGNWTLHISDWATGDSGVLVGWTLNLTPQFRVTTLSDAPAPGPAGSLRSMLAAANTTPGDDRIVFDPGLEGTINLSGGVLSITQPVTIQGPGASTVEISGNDTSRVFVINTPGAVEINDLTIRNGRSSGGTGNFAGGIYVQAAESFHMNYCTVRDNHCDGITAAYGGGLYIASPVLEAQLFACAVHGNFVQAATATYGGGVASQAGLTILEACTLSGNTATAGTVSFGGGVYSHNPLALRSCTITANSAEYGGVAFDAALTLRNNIVSGNGGGDLDSFGALPPVTSQGGNIVGEPNGGIVDGVNGDRVGIDPRLMPLGDYGGPTWTHALLPDSPAIDRGTPNASPTDQRGRVRGNDGDCDRLAGTDIGAFEYNAGPGLYLDGNNDYVLAPSGAMWSLTNAFTLEAWVQLDSISDPPLGATRILSTRTAGNAGFGFGQLGGQLLFTTFGRQDYVSSRAVLPLHERTHVAVVFDTAHGARFYVNGEHVDTVSGSVPAAPSTSLTIGRNPASDSQFWNGAVEDVRIWSVARTDQDIAGNLFRRLRGDEAGLVANWRFDEGAGVSAADSANGYDGTMHGGAVWLGSECGCLTDLDGDGATAISDLAVLLSNFAAGSASGADGDLNGDHTVDISDLAMLLAAFGTICD